MEAPTGSADSVADPVKAAALAPKAGPRVLAYSQRAAACKRQNHTPPLRALHSHEPPNPPTATPCGVCSTIDGLKP